jgi:hypothetical protein
MSTEGTSYVYQVEAKDPDNDPFTFTLKSGPEGMEIDKKTGLLRWEIRGEHRGTYPYEIEVSDNEGAKSFQKFNVNVGIR